MSFAGLRPATYLPTQKLSLPGELCNVKKNQTLLYPCCPPPFGPNPSLKNKKDQRSDQLAPSVMGGAPSRVLDEPPLFLGGADVVKDAQFFDTHRITAVLSLGDEAPTVPTIALQMQLRKDDSPVADLLSHFEDIVEFIHNARSTGHSTFVHCHAGISRSSTCVAAYLMAHLNLSLQDALAHLVRCGDTVCPNPGFREQLLEFERTSARALHDTLQRRLAPTMLSGDLRCVASVLVRSKADVDAQAASEWLFLTNGKPVPLADLATLADDYDGNGPYVTVRELEDDPSAPPAQRRSPARALARGCGRLGDGGLCPVGVPEL